MRFSLSREFYLPASVRDAAPTFDQDDIQIWAYDPCAAIAFKGKAAKPLWHYKFRSTESRDKRIQETLDSAKAANDRKAKNAQERKEFKHTIKEGDIFRCSWGYDQTNVDFYQVVRVVGAFVEIQEINATTTRSNGPADYVAPVKDSFCGPVMRKKPSSAGDGRPCLKISSFQYAYPWSGEPCYQTAFGWGH